jgi:aspartate/methionine/tyrosine aminotransferase
MHFPRMPIEAESPEQFGYDRVRFNLTESSVRDRSLGELGLDLAGLTLCYGDHLGAADLRALIAKRAGPDVRADDVLITAGASAALFIVAISLLDRGDHMIVVRPNYATNIATPRGLGCEVDCLDLDFDRAFALDVDALAAKVRPTTRLISLTTPHNPTGVALSRETLTRVIALAQACGAHVLIDETYRDMSFVPPPPPAATLSERAISVGSLSKGFGLPGIRVGWIVSREPNLMHRFLCTKEQIGICGSVVDEAIALKALEGADAWLPENDARLRAALHRVEAWMAREPLLEWVAPAGGCVAFPRIREDAGVDVAAFHRTLNADHAAYVGPGHWFETPDRYFRIGYGWPTPDELDGGLEAISTSLRAARA